MKQVGRDDFVTVCVCLTLQYVCRLSVYTCTSVRETAHANTQSTTNNQSAGRWHGTGRRVIVVH